MSTFVEISLALSLLQTEHVILSCKMKYWQKYQHLTQLVPNIAGFVVDLFWPNE